MHTGKKKGVSPGSNLGAEQVDAVSAQCGSLRFQAIVIPSGKPTELLKIVDLHGFTDLHIENRDFP